MTNGAVVFGYEPDSGKVTYTREQILSGKHQLRSRPFASICSLSKMLARILWRVHTSKYLKRYCYYFIILFTKLFAHSLINSQPISIKITWITCTQYYLSIHTGMEWSGASNRLVSRNVNKKMLKHVTIGVLRVYRSLASYIFYLIRRGWKLNTFVSFNFTVNNFFNELK